MADFYIRSANALDRVLRDECSVKAAAAAYSDAGRVLAILVNSLAYRSALMFALQHANVFALEHKVFTLTPSASSANQNGKPNRNGNGNGNGNANGNANGKQRCKSMSKLKSDRGVQSEYPSKEALLLVLCHDLLFQSRGIQASKTWPPKVTLETYRRSIHSCLVKLQIRQAKPRIQDLRSGALYQQMTARMPRWIRINTLRATRDEVFGWLCDNRYTQVYAQELCGVKQFSESKHVPGLLAFHANATSGLLASEMYKRNWVVMQDLASCFPAYILDPPAGAQVVDATSAPGNKTSHVSAIMYSKSTASQPASGKVYAFERDGVRYKTLVKRLSAVGALSSTAPKPSTSTTTGNVIAQRKDFLTTHPAQFSTITHMLLDPSCSGSGIVNRLDFLKEDDDVQDATLPTANHQAHASAVEVAGSNKLEKRLDQLSQFQLLMVRHAFKFPSLQRVVYSTCSIHATENEQVVLRALECDEAKRFGWKLAPREHVLPSWPVRGNLTACNGNPTIADSMIRCVPGGVTDGDKPNVESCNGFFVACFVKSPTHTSLTRKRSFNQVDSHQQETHEQTQTQESQPNPTTTTTTTSTTSSSSSSSNANANSAANRKKKLQKRRKKLREQLPS